MTSSALADRRCVPSRDGAARLRGARLAEWKQQIDAEWDIIDEHHLLRIYRFGTFREPLAFVNALGELAEQEGHHPEITLAWGAATVRIWTHRADGLTENDFVLAAKADRLFSGARQTVLDLSAETRLTPAEVAARACTFFVTEHNLVLIEYIQHLHGAEGAMEISVTGGRLAGNRTYESDEVFEQITAHAETEYGLTPVYRLLHLHASHKDDAGHLMIQIRYGSPVEVRAETKVYEFLAKEFLAGL